jgi:hypothetical protein
MCRQATITTPNEPSTSTFFVHVCIVMKLLIHYVIKGINQRVEHGYGFVKNLESFVFALIDDYPFVFTIIQSILLNIW